MQNKLHQYGFSNPLEGVNTKIEKYINNENHNTFMNKTILCIVGPSCSGKSTVAEYLTLKYGYNFIESYTDRPKRTPDEKGHTFVTPEEFDKFNKEDMLAFTNFGNKRYCCLHKEVVDGINIYVIDEVGLKYLLDNFRNKYNILSIWVQRDIEYREEIGDIERIARDEGMFKEENEYLYDFILDNNGDLTETIEKVDEIIEEITC